MNNILLKKQIEEFLIEDLGHGDLSTEFICDQNQSAEAIIHSKERGIICGLEVAETVFKLIDGEINFYKMVSEGQLVEKGQVIAKVVGKASTILKGERLALNLLQRLSGIATMTNRYQEKIKKYNTFVTDTRKTTPGLRLLEKYAVTVGGGRNHRFGLYDAVMLKDNHIKIAGSISKAVQKVREKIPHTMKIEVEVETLEGVKEALEAKADIIMLDNMTVENLKKAVEIIGDKAITEASGGITLETIEEVAKTGVQYISVGALTHSYKALDISLDMFDKKS
ncbi:nicotinate-nucleotide pyrophosphorylase [carboxylating] [Anaerobranca californiensis DSM 14826]|jgi:nicotinate-nucleotide pyrophosphorylase (carboxylating)|uniref:Probable nicotinate-nucleotide pyrophosphorylase [carboxylating] n=1 Tax=Anaerobranca californiensis DSM 14826 TaxID=1120989 RepID=A0A1M6RLG1_9FIRM|nr:carboxylating nicotinate-nucleotide diphosphorylase [Anaerobranca californiensis]SHK33269.1 nicotinate-nucleotide pyrophosphorylase [carboxylating] [Anaerobranca californiensis DSM 14826]